jgi:hypothetical protein
MQETNFELFLLSDKIWFYIKNGCDMTKMLSVYSCELFVHKTVFIDLEAKEC